MGKAIVIPRNRLKEAKKRNELNNGKIRTIAKIYARSAAGTDARTTSQNSTRHEGSDAKIPKKFDEPMARGHEGRALWLTLGMIVKTLPTL